MKKYLIEMANEPELFITATDDEEAAWEAKSIARLFNDYLVNVTPIYDA
tara:strand:- start:1734 stop:1880 length:147 start_codon:yes stop_codon:yes gene_type:complete